jgi:hypothetical protein
MSGFRDDPTLMTSEPENDHPPSGLPGMAGDKCDMRPLFSGAGTGAGPQVVGLTLQTTQEKKTDNGFSVWEFSCHSANPNVK